MPITELIIIARDNKGEVTIHRDKEGGRFITGYGEESFDTDILDQAIDLIEKAYKEENNART